MRARVASLPHQNEILILPYQLTLFVHCLQTREAAEAEMRARVASLPQQQRLRLAARYQEAVCELPHSLDQNLTWTDA